MNVKPLDYLATIEHIFEHVKRTFYQTVADTKTINKGRLNAPLTEYKWHPSVFLPTSQWKQVLSPTIIAKLIEQSQLINNKDPLKVDAYFANFVAAFTWRYTKSIYRFDDYTFDCLIKHSAGKYLDHQLLTNLPEGCVYIELTNPLEIAGLEVHGIYALLDFSSTNIDTLKNTLPDQLIITFDTHNPFDEKNLAQLNPMPTILFDIKRSGKINQQIKFQWGLNLSSTEKLNEQIAPVISLISSICADDIAIDNFTKNSTRQSVTQKPSFKDLEAAYWTKGEYRVNAPANHKMWRVGVKYGVDYRAFLARQQTYESKTEYRITGVHWSVYIQDYEIRLKFMPPRMNTPFEIEDKLKSYFGTENDSNTFK
jgi:hypothetical protein